MICDQHRVTNYQNNIILHNIQLLFYYYRNTTHESPENNVEVPDIPNDVQDFIDDYISATY